MSTIQIESNISLEQLLKAVSQLPDEEIGRFTEQIVALRARRIAPSLTIDEETLLHRINQALPANDQRRYDALITKRQDETLTSAEHDELLCLADRQEAHDADRLAALSDLARLRGLSLTALMVSLDIPPSPDA